MLYTFFLLFLLSETWTEAADISGKVSAADGSVLGGVSVYIESGSKGAISNERGEYLIKKLKNGTYFITASILGYKSERAEISIIDNESIKLDFVLTQVAVQLGEVVVSANKHEENLQQIPISVSAITPDRLGELGVKKRSDLSTIAPNTLVAETGSHMTDFINIRGITPSTPFQTTTLYYLDGVPIFGYGQNPMYLNDIERIEIIRGPQSTIYGRNALAGVINITTQKPTNRTKFNAGVDVGSYNFYNYNAGVSSPLVKDKLFARLSAYYYTKDGYFTNTVKNTNAGGSKGYGGTFNLKYLPFERLSAEVFMNFEYIHESVWPFAQTPDSAMKSPWKIQRDLDSYIKKNNLLGSFKLAYNGSYMDVISTTAYQSVSGFEWLYDADFTELDFVGFEEYSPYYIISEELRLESKNSNSPLRWTAGAFYSFEQTDDIYSAIIGKDFLSGIGINIYPIKNTTEGYHKTKDGALFAQFSYKFFDRLEITAGWRYEEQNIAVNTVTGYYYNGDSVPIALPVFVGKEISNSNKTFGFLCHKYAVSYNLDEKNMIFLSASRGYHGGAFNSGANKRYPFYEPENTWNYELGYKTTLFDERLRMNAGMFYIDWTKQQVLSIGDFSNPLSTITNAGKTVSKGLELELHAIPLKGLTLSAAAGYLDARFSSFTFVDPNKADSLFDYSGNYLSFAPKFSSLISAKFEYPIKLWKHSFVLGAEIDYQHVDPYYMSHINESRSVARNLLNARLGMVTRSFDLIFWAKNLTDYRYIYAVYEYRGGKQALLGAPLTLGLTLNFRLQH